MPVNKMDKALIFAYKVQRKFRRETRKRVTPVLTAWDRRRLQSAMRGKDARALLLDYAKLQKEEWLLALSQDEAEALLKKAEGICAHRFDLLGSGECYLGDSIDWHSDFKTGFRWPSDVHHLKIAWDAVPPGTDIKVPWELSRCQHFTTLGLATQISGDPRYYQTFKDQIRSWIGDNKCGFGVNWVCAMDVAIRAVNWLTAIALFQTNLEQDEDELFAGELVESLWLHARHIMKNLEWQGPKSPSLANHFLADISGVLAIGVLFSGSVEGKQWKRFSMKWFETEIRRQVFRDGANFETSTSYHRLSAEMFLWANLIVKRSGDVFSEGYHERLFGMGRFVSAYTSPSGRAVQFGDNDGGRLLTAGIEDPADHRYLLQSSDSSFGGRVNRLLFGGGCPENGFDGQGETEGAFEQGGYWFGGLGHAWMGIRAGEVSHAGAHSHADQLSFVLAVNGRDIIVDPGTGVYSGNVAKRNAYRSTAAHNAPQLNGCEANHFAGGMAGLFRMRDDTQTEVDLWSVERNSIEFNGFHSGYARKHKGCICTRNLKLERGLLRIRDELTSLGVGDRVDWTIHLAPGVMVVIEGGELLLTLENMSIKLTMEPLLEYEVLDASFSPTYGVEMPSQSLRLWRSIAANELGKQQVLLLWGEKDF